MPPVSEQGLAPLQWDDSLAQAARAHAELLLQNGQLSHQLPGEASLAARAAQAGAHFQAIAENIAEAPSVESIQNSWMNSPPHRANILDPNLNAVGFGVLGHGSYFYAVADFSHAVPIRSFEEVESAIGKLLLARGIQVRRIRARTPDKPARWSTGPRAGRSRFLSCAGKAPTCRGCQTVLKTDSGRTATVRRRSAPAPAPTRRVASPLIASPYCSIDRLLHTADHGIRPCQIFDHPLSFLDRELAMSSPLPGPITWVNFDAARRI